MQRLAILSIALLLAACAGLLGSSGRQGVSSSLVDYLYPQGGVPPKPEGAIAQLQLPLAVGLAFVPPQSGSNPVLSEAERMRVLNDVKKSFDGRDFIREIAVIPDAYLHSGRGFDALEQTARLYDLDVMALVSYDQVAHSAETAPSFLYWTIVGATVVKGNQNDVQTFVDTTVFAVATRKLLFRAPGVNEFRSRSPPVDVERDVRAAQQQGFELAMTDMTVNLDKALSAFKERIDTDGNLRATRADGADDGGGGSADLVLLSLIALAGLGSARRRGIRRHFHQRARRNPW